MTESAVSDMLEQEFQRLGVKGGGLVQFGPSAALPHGGPGDRKLAAGDVVLIDAGCRVRGYTSDVTRTVAFGPPSDELRKVYAVVDRAQRAGIDALRAGSAPEDVDRAARKVIEDAGYGASFTHRLGHGLGMDGHEHPYLVGGNATPLVRRQHGDDRAGHLSAGQVRGAHRGRLRGPRGRASGEPLRPSRRARRRSRLTTSTRRADCFISRSRRS